MDIFKACPLTCPYSIVASCFNEQIIADDQRIPVETEEIKSGYLISGLRGDRK